MTIRFKLTMGAIAAILAANSLLVLANVRYFQQTWREELQSRVRLDLNSARTAYNNHVELVARSLGTASLDRSLATALTANRREDFAAWANRFYKAKGMDFFLLLDPQGKVLYRAQYPKHHGDDLARNPLVAEAIEKRARPRAVFSFRPTIFGTKAPILSSGRDSRCWTSRPQIPRSSRSNPTG